MRISVVGTGYVGAVTASCFAELGNSVTCIDVVKAKVDAINAGKSPIYEPGLDALISRNLKAGRLSATTSLAKAVAGSELAFICVGTPPKEDGSTDLSYVFSAAKEMGKALKEKTGFRAVVVKSTVPPGTSEQVSKIIAQESGKRAGQGFGVCMNPEFLREGCAISDFMNPDRIVIGAKGAKERAMLRRLYSKFKAPFIETDLRTAEMIKYASNAFLATKVSFINEVANICQRLGIDVYEVAQGMGHDVRIGRRFLNAGVGWGGSCFGKDVKSLVRTAKGVGYKPGLLESAIELNDAQPAKMLSLLHEELKLVRGRKIAVLGLAFKPDTDDMRDAPSIRVIRALLMEGAQAVAYDPQAMEGAKKLFHGSGLSFAGSACEALKGADACLIMTEWKEFEKLGRKDFLLMRNPLVIEGRQSLRNTRMNGVKYRGLGRLSYG